MKLVLKDVQALLNSWFASQEDPYAMTVESPEGIQSCTGRISQMDDREAFVTDEKFILRIRYALTEDALISRSGGTTTLSLTFGDGGTAFLVAGADRMRGALNMSDDEVMPSAQPRLGRK